MLVNKVSTSNYTYEDSCFELKFHQQGWNNY